MINADLWLVKMLRMSDCWVFHPQENIYIAPFKAQGYTEEEAESERKLWKIVF